MGLVVVHDNEVQLQSASGKRHQPLSSSHDSGNICAELRCITPIMRNGRFRITVSGVVYRWCLPCRKIIEQGKGGNGVVVAKFIRQARLGRFPHFREDLRGFHRSLPV